MADSAPLASKGTFSIPGRRAKIRAWRKVALQLTGDKEADALLSKDPLALLIGMVLDQQIPLERAFRGPGGAVPRHGRPARCRGIAAMDPEKFAELFKATRPAPLPRIDGRSGAGGLPIVADEYGGKAAAPVEQAARRQRPDRAP